MTGRRRALASVAVLLVLCVSISSSTLANRVARASEEQICPHLCKHEDHVSCKQFCFDEGSCRNLNGRWNDVVSSINTHGACVRVWAHWDCSGPYEDIFPASECSHGNLALCKMSDRISSISSCSDEALAGLRPPPSVSKAIGDFLASIPNDDERTETMVAEFPWAARVGTKNKNGGNGLTCFRNGVLISSRYVLTSAFAARFCGEPLTVRLGEHDSDESDEDCSTVSGKEVCAPAFVEIPVAEVIVHPDFETDKNKRTYAWHDVALIRLARQVDFNDFVRPLSLPPHQANSTDNGRSEVGARLRAVGWGRTNDSNSNTFVHSPLVQLPSEVLPLASCDQYENFASNAETDLCITSMSRKVGFGICRLWGGSALVTSSRRPQLLGLVSTVICNTDPQKVISLRVAPYVPWILDSMKSRSSSDSL